jgi:hypothetical protein
MMMVVITGMAPAKDMAGRCTGQKALAREETVSVNPVVKEYRMNVVSNARIPNARSVVIAWYARKYLNKRTFSYIVLA